MESFNEILFELHAVPVLNAPIVFWNSMVGKVHWKAILFLSNKSTLLREVVDGRSLDQNLHTEVLDVDDVERLAARRNHKGEGLQIEARQRGKPVFLVVSWCWILEIVHYLPIVNS